LCQCRGFMASAKTHLFLFDIDGTLITSGGAGVHALKLAVKDFFGVEDDLAGVEIAGRTDKWITSCLFRKFGQAETPERVTAFLDIYLGYLHQQLPHCEGQVLPGIVELLEELKARETVSLALLTGNLGKGAELKLTHYGVWHYFEFGAYADDSPNRNDLGPVAQQRAFDKYRVKFAPENTFILGDTPHDIACGEVIGAKTVAIATGNYTAEQLAAYNPTYLFNDLSDVPGVLAKLGIA